MSEQASAADVSASDDRASNPQANMANMTGSGQDLEVQQHADVLGCFNDEDSCFDLISTTHDDLESMVLSWSISSVRKGLKVPMMHEKEDLSPSDYLKGFERPLIEETRAMISFSLGCISQSTYFELLNVLATPSKNMSYLDVGSTYGDHVVENGDLFLLSGQERNELEELSDLGVFVLATNIGHHPGYIRGFDAKRTRAINSEHKFAIFLCNIIENVHIWNTLHINIKDKTVIKLLSSPSLIAKENCEICTNQMKISAILMNYDLNQEQKHLAAKILSNANCVHSSINIAWGFAGTGKTKTLSIVLATLLHAKVRTVVCASNTLHCSTLVSRLYEFIKRSQFCYGLDLSIGNILLLSDMGAVKNNAVKQFCLEWKINEIVPCMLWRSKMQNFISFLEKGFRELYKGGIKGPLKVLDLLKELFGHKSKTLVKLLTTLRKYFPPSVFPEEVDKELTCLVDAVEGFNATLAKEGITDGDIMIVFGIYNPADCQAKPPRKKISSIKNPRAAPTTQSTFVADLRKSKDRCLKHLKCLAKILDCPYEKDIEWIRIYLIKEASLIICLPKNAFLLHKIEIRHTPILIVSGAAQITECQLLPILSVPSLQHIWLIGDHKQLCPTIASPMNKGSRFSLSLFERLISLGVGKCMLSTQYRMHPDICCFPNTQFYEKSLSSAQSVKSDEIKLRYTNFMFVNVDLEAMSDDAIKFLINAIIQDRENPSTKHDDLKLDIGVICSAKKKVLEYGPINLSIQSIDEIEAKEYDILIIAAYGLPSNKNVINYMITRAKQYLWIIGNKMELAASSTWKSLIDSAKQITYCSESTFYSGSSTTIKNLSSQDLLVSTLGTISHSKTPFEFTWLGRPHNGKLLLPPVRDQRGENHCTLHSSLATMEFLNKHRSASLVPAEDFIPTFSTCKLLAKYTEKHGEFGKETSTGIKRLENVLDTLQKEGAISKLDNTVHKISSFHRIYDSRKKQEEFLEAAARKPRDGKGMVGSFPLSHNYSEYRPGDIYMFDPNRPVLSPLSRKLASHAVMLIGATEGNTKIEDGHFVMQNSQGEYFGQGGIGRVAMSSIRFLYELTL